MGNKKRKCGGPIVNSVCVSYDGPTLTFLREEDELDCNASVADVIEKIDEYLKELLDSNDFTGLTPGSFDFDPATVTASELHQLELDKLDELAGQIEALQTQIEGLNIGNEVITITLPSCLTGDAAPCATGTDQYQLISLLTLFANKICDHETRITNLE